MHQEKLTIAEVEALFMAQRTRIDKVVKDLDISSTEVNLAHNSCGGFQHNKGGYVTNPPVCNGQQTQDSYNSPRDTYGGSNNRGGRGYSGRRRWINQSWQQPPRTISQLCQKPGHVVLQCFYKFDKLFLGPTSFTSSTPTLATSNPMQVMHAMVATPNTVQDLNWYLDSGKSHKLHFPNSMTVYTQPLQMIFTQFTLLSFDSKLERLHLLTATNKNSAATSGAGPSAALANKQSNHHNPGGREYSNYNQNNPGRGNGRGSNYHNNHGGGSSNRDPRAFVATPEVVHHEGWYADSGASNHLTSDQENMNNRSTYSGKDKLTVGDGNQLNITYIGSGNLHSNYGYNQQLNDVLLVPKIAKNLISISKLTTDNKVFLEFFSDVCFVKDIATKTVVLQGKLKDGLYQSFTFVSREHVSKKDVWHRKLGHPSSKVINQVLSLSNVKVSTNENPSFCEACQFRKSHALPFKSSSSRATNVLDLIHTDLWGPAPVMSNTNLRHIVEMGLTLLAQANMPLKFWCDAFQTSVYLINRLPTLVLKGKSLYETLFTKQPDYTFLKPLNAQNTDAHVKDKTTNVPQSNSQQNTSQPSQALTDINHQENHSAAPQSVMSGSSQQQQHQVDLTNNLFVELDFGTPPVIDQQHTPTRDEPTTKIPVSKPQTEPQPSHPMITRSKVGTFKPKVYSAQAKWPGNTSESKTLSEALAHKGWNKAMSDENMAPKKNKTWVLVQRKKGMNIVGNRWAPRAWYDSLKQTLIKWSFVNSRVNTSLFLLKTPKFVIMVLIYADDIVITGALQYLTDTRPDIAFAVNKLSQFHKYPTTTHWSAAKRILRYLKGTIHHGIHIKYSDHLSITGYCDANWACCPYDRKSIAGYCVYFGESFLAWSSKKQTVVARSSTEFEYRALAQVAAEIIWIESLLEEMHFKLPSTPVIWCDNMSAKALASNPVFHTRTKYIKLDVHFVRDRVLQRIVELRYIPSQKQVVDCFTKGLTHSKFKAFIDKLGLINSPLRLKGGVKTD
uniref:GAG-pre-integrase domain-containing protein n=1 Tax=Cannabis sativa TaxID=3483 RepID=A0A803QE35_CANSA